MAKITELKLKPCPFCGASDDEDLEFRQVYGGVFPSYSYIRCKRCNGMVLDTNMHHCMYDIFEKWNRRASDGTT